MRVTYKDIARVAEVDVSTVSLAINRHPRIPEKTRNRILRIAEELGYRPDPAVSSLAAGRWQQRKDYRGLTLAMVIDPRDSTEQEWQLYAQGARSRAERIGYSVDIFHITDYPRTPRLLQVLRQRGIRGLMLVQSRRDYAEELQDETLVPAVHCGYLRPVRTDVVMPNLVSAVRLAWSEVIRRFGGPVLFYLPREHDFDYDSARMLRGAAAQLNQPSETTQTAVRQECFIAENEEHLEQLMKSGPAPAAVITIDAKTLEPLKRAQQRGDLPEHTPLIPLHSLPPHAHRPAIDLQLEKVGAAAVDFLELKIRRVPLGEHSSRQSLLIDPVWVE